MYINRQKYLDKLISQKDKDIVKVITGIRRCGKSVLLFNIYYDYLLSIGVKKENIIKINLETKRNEGLRDADALYNAVVEQIVTDEKYYVLIDEIQFVDGFEDIVNGLRVDYNCDVYITGSNSKLLSKDINTKMRGRSIEIKVYPLSFAEFYAYHGGDKRQCFNNYLMYGGLPYLFAESDNKNKVEYLKMICDTVVGKDIIDRHGIRQSNLFEAVIEFSVISILSSVTLKLSFLLNSVPS